MYIPNFESRTAPVPRKIYTQYICTVSPFVRYLRSMSVCITAESAKYMAVANNSSLTAPRYRSLHPPQAPQSFCETISSAANMRSFMTIKIEKLSAVVSIETRYLCCILELLQKAHISAVEQANVVNTEAFF